MSATTRPSTAAAPCTVEHFAAIVAAHGHDLHRYAQRLAGDRHTAEDLVQESLLRAWRSLGQLHSAPAAKAWLYTIVRRENARRFTRPCPQPSELPPEAIAERRPAYDTRTEAFVLRRALHALPAEYREPLVLQILHGHSQQEIAARLGLNAATVGTRLFRARQRLREALGERV
jgi:RNA polymerase sigma-70 factor (ECF subfamily)